MATTYILRCQNGDCYVGSTNNFERRLKEHQKGKNCATKGRLPVKTAYRREFRTLREARKFEYFLKRQRNKKFYEKIFKNEIVWPRRLVA